MLETVILWSTFVLNPIAGTIIVGGLLIKSEMRRFPVWHRLGLTICAAGLLGQAVRSAITIFTGFAPSDLELPWWIFKDWGLVILAITFALSRDR